MINVTIIIPTYNRPEYLRRILTYYDSFGEQFNVFVADSSSDENKNLNRNIISSVSHLHIRYLHHYSTQINPHHKFADALNDVSTKYCVFCADDDFVTPNGIRESVDFLETNPDFIAAQGNYITFHVDGEGDEPRFAWNPNYAGKSITFPEAERRLGFHLSNYLGATVYAVHRTETLQSAYRGLLESKVDPVFFGELLPSMLTVIHGKLKYLRTLYAARDAGSIMAGCYSANHTETGRWPSLRDAIEQGIYGQEYTKLRQCLATHLNKQSQLSVAESSKLVDKAMSMYLKNYFPPMSRIAPLMTKAGRFLDNLDLPDWLDGGIRSTYRRLTGSKLYDSPDTLSFYSLYRDDLERIQRFVLNSADAS